MEPKSPSKSKLLSSRFTQNPRLQKVILTAILMILIFGIAGGYLIFGKRLLIPEEMKTHFTVVLDCGSTGSRVSVYEWMGTNRSHGYGNLSVLLHSYPENVNKSNGCQYHCMQTEPGLHNFVNNMVQVRSSLEPLIRYAEQWVPLKRRSMTPLFVLATAGMRMLAIKDAELILGDVEIVVKEHGFLYRKTWIRVLSGKEEAYYGWIALNYKMGVFRNSLKSSSTLGLLDLGGSSLQVVAEVDGAVKNKHVSRSKFGRFEHDIVAYSLEAFGLNEAFDRTVIMLSHSQDIRESVGGMLEVKHPCIGSGFVQNYTCHVCFAQNSSDSRYMSYQVQDNELNNVLLVGEPNWEKCKVLAREAAINSSSPEWFDNSKCFGLSSYGGNAKLNLTKTSYKVTRYHALSGFFAVHRALNLSNTANLTTLWGFGQRLCSTLSSDKTNVNGGHYCFKLPYLTSLIENALCLRGKEIIFGPGDVSWTLGASLIEGQFLWLNDEKSRNRIFAWKDNGRVFSPLFVFVLLSFLLLIVYWCQIKLPMPSRKAAGTRTSLPSYLCPKRQPN